ncbi:MAG: hypothetical protein ABSB28_12075 [Candidatus Bathyarchaeia archaeon]
MQKIVKLEHPCVQGVLAKQLVKLKTLIPCDEVTAVRWKPQVGSSLSGEVAEGIIYVYDEDLRDALETLRHEYLDCILTRKIINPLTAIVNLFIEDKTREVYRQKERVVDALSKLLKNSCGE